MLCLHRVLGQVGPRHVWKVVRSLRGHVLAITAAGPLYALALPQILHPIRKPHAVVGGSDRIGLSNIYVILVCFLVLLMTIIFSIVLLSLDYSKNPYKYIKSLRAYTQTHIHTYIYMSFITEKKSQFKGFEVECPPLLFFFCIITISSFV